MTRAWVDKRMRPALACALRLLVVFTLAFSGTYGVQTALAADAQGAQALVAQAEEGAASEGAGEGGGSSGNGVGESPAAPDEPATPETPETPDVPTTPETSATPDAPSTPETPDAPDTPATPDTPDTPTAPETPEPSEPSPTADARVDDLGIYVKPKDVTESVNIVAYATAGLPEAHLELTESGGSIDFDVRAYWNDASESDDWGHVSWTLAPGDEAVASITRDTGMLVARGGTNGTVTVTATADPGYAADGAELKAQIAVDVTGQQSAMYVTSIVICDEAGEPIVPSYTFHDADLSTAMLELQARVTVVDPATQQETVYQVKPGNGLSAQTGGAIADLQWYVGNSAWGYISDDGIYRPLMQANVDVHALSNAGADGTPVEGSATIIMPGEGEAHPQDSLTVDVVWETAPDQVVASKTFSVGDMEALGTHVVTYTAFGGGLYGFMTFTGRGPYLADVLKDVGVDTDGVKELQIESFDNPYVVSWDLLVGKDRFYFPNMDIGSEAEAVQVAPMLAIESKRATLGTSDPVPTGDLTADDRFRLLFGAGMGDEGFTTTSMQRYWIHTIHVVLVGAPPVEPDQPEPDEPDQPDAPGGNSGGAPAAAGGGGDNAGSPTATAGKSSEPDAEQARSDATTQGRHNQGAWSVLQAVNKNDSDVDGIDLDNPFGPFTGAVGIGCLAAGGAEALVRFRWQHKTPELRG